MPTHRPYVAIVLMALAATALLAATAAAQLVGVVPTGGSSAARARTGEGAVTAPPTQPGPASFSKNLFFGYLRSRFLVGREPASVLAPWDRGFIAARRRTLR